MTCPVCGGKVKAFDSRSREGLYVWRRKKCVDCGYRFTTLEFELDALKHSSAGVALLREYGYLKKEFSPGRPRT